MRKIFILPVILTFISGLLSGCVLPVQVVLVQPTGQVNAPQPSVEKSLSDATDSALQATVFSLETSVVQLAQPSATATNGTVITQTLASNNPTATATITPTATVQSNALVSIVPVSQGAYTVSGVPYSYAYSICDRATFISDMGISDGANFTAGTGFTKTWRLRNDGTCTWTSNYMLVFDHGNQLGGPTSVNLPAQVVPGEIIDLSINLVAPTSNGIYQGYWMLQDPNGARFGVGDNASTAIWALITVGPVYYSYQNPYYYYPTATPFPNYYNRFPFRNGFPDGYRDPNRNRPFDGTRFPHHTRVPTSTPTP